ncbi:GNAT family N-acetyltransferase [Paenibacillus piri]|uniref:GNAT family N-acetyltransferase n=1 Tax=Paenibacillus piri TaxID=2547395 RepID=A0A4R5KN58_9BACL|nr:GNAT family N-acetyltransferase [Paenibacillus piri]TDF97089.1 GNAT family N-acetyltransferase [Paenibacillus piri]
MYRCVAYNELMKDAWDRLASSKGTVFHSTAFRHILLSSFGYECRYHAVVDNEDRICALIPLAAGRNLGLTRAAVALPFVNYADICAISEEAFRFAIGAIERLQAELRLGYIELRLKAQHMGGSGWSAQLQHHTFVLPLSEDEQQVLALSSSSNRNHVRKVYKNDWFAVSYDPGHLESFYRVYVLRMKQLGSPAPDIRFFKRFFEYMPEHTVLLTVLDKQSGNIVGGMLLLASPSNATLYYPYGANLAEYNNRYVNNFMYWEAIRFGIRNGFSYLDLGRSQTGSGTYKYKEQWGAAAKQLQYMVYGGEGNQSGAPDRQKLGLLVELWKIAPRFITDYAGKKLIKYVMP